LKWEVPRFTITVFQVYTGHPPFSEVRHDITVALQLVGGVRPKRPSNVSRIMSDDLWNLVEACWSHKISDRPNMATVVDLMRNTQDAPK